MHDCAVLEMQLGKSRMHAKKPISFQSHNKLNWLAEAKEAIEPGPPLLSLCQHMASCYWRVDFGKQGKHHLQKLMLCNSRVIMAKGCQLVCIMQQVRRMHRAITIHY